MKKWKSPVGLDWKKGLFGLAVAAMVLLLCFAEAPKKSLLLAAACVAAGLLKLKIRRDWLKYMLGGAVALALLTVTFHTVPTFLGLVGFGMNIGKQLGWGWNVYFYNELCIGVVILLIFVICGKWRLSVALGTFAMSVLSLINGFIHQFRGRELMYLDLFSVGTAMNVADQYHPDMNPFMWFRIGIWAALILLLFAIPGTQKRWSVKPRLGVLAVNCLLILTLVLTNMTRPCWTWGAKGTYINGFYLNFYLGFRDSFISAPETYDPEAIKGEEEAYPAEEQTGTGQLPNILVIMNESFSDFRFMDENLRTNIPVMPFLDSLEENTIRGKAAVSIFGGNTANSEFEFLTGHSMAFLPEGTLPYQFYIEEELFSLPWLLRSYGYETFATHPYLSSGWDRTQAYPLLGFEGYSFQEDYPNENLLRKYISDQEMYEYILEKLENQGDDPLFLFGITMQNHGGYEYEGDLFEQRIWLEDYPGYPMAEQYLSLINYSDQALEYLLTELEKDPRDTVVLFFGDHLPKVETSFYNELRQKDDGTLESHMLQYTVPFVIWANFDIPEGTVECTSLNYLGRYLLETAGLELPAFYRFLEQMEQTVPAVCAMGYYSPETGSWQSVDEARGEEALWLERYRNLQYNSMFDRENLSSHFFGQYFASK